MVTVNYRLTPEENTEDALAANDAGKLTAKQQQRLLTAIDVSKRPIGSFESAEEKQREKRRFIVFLLIAYAIMVLFRNGVALVLWLILLLWITLRDHSKLARRYRHYYDQLNSARQKLEADDYAIETYTGPGYFVRDLVPESDQTPNLLEYMYEIRTNEHELRFRVSEGLWEKLHPPVESIRLYYLAAPFMALLSVEAIPIPEPPTDEKLATVIGLGADGELIYKDEDAPGMVNASG